MDQAIISTWIKPFSNCKGGSHFASQKSSVDGGRGIAIQHPGGDQGTRIEHRHAQWLAIAGFEPHKRPRSELFRRGVHGDLILDEFAFHEDGRAIWDAAEPILSSNPDFLCRIASTLNGTRNMFYQLLTGGLCAASIVPRSLAYAMGELKIYHPITRQPITPEQARELSVDKRAYDQNYECTPGDENMALLTHDLISAAEDHAVGIICRQDWSPDALALLSAVRGQLSVYAGIDVGRSRDLTCIAACEKAGPLHLVRGLLRIENMRLPQQQERLGAVCRLPAFNRAAIDMTGIGLGLTEYAQDAYGRQRIQGINFGSTVPLTRELAAMTQ
jgi:phage FluMu gp28-like protein